MLEKAYFKKGKGIFQLRARLKKAGVAVPVDSVPLEDIHDSDSGDDEALECDGKHEGGNRRLRAYFGRRRTHNEQLIMRPCGVILSRATFFGSEAISAVHVREQVLIPSHQANKQPTDICKSHIPIARVNT